MSLINPDHDPKRKVLKRSKTGMEIEYHVLEQDGKISAKAAKLIADLKKQPGVDVTPEVGSNMIEFGCFPGVETFNPVLNMISTVQTAYEHAQNMDLTLYPFATYPGKFTPTFSNPKKYATQVKVWGKEHLLKGCQIVGFHHHYSLPKGVFDAKTKTLKLLRKSKLSRSMMSMYNFEIAIDPILTLFSQSSPFYDGTLFAKDSRMVVYRGGKKLEYMQGSLANFQQLGGLPPYKQTATDLYASLEKRWERFEQEVKSKDPTVNFDELYPYKLDISWNPIKLNKHGTLEQRGMDSNYLSVLSAITVLLKFSLRKIQREFIQVMPTDYGLDEAFKIENGIMYLPPHTLVRNELQKASAYEGYANDELYNYAKRFLHYAQSVTPKRYARVIAPIKDMVEHKKSMSDKITAYAKRKGYIDENNCISNEDSAQLALYYSSKLPKDLEETKRKLEKVAAL